ncbi:hypothetical protein CTE05_30280 [Cellulomonas terrae]|uniref:Uncharacterized protein n=2 Tax=Cellulomonas terrae TaxID=311234 RepID=A0A511JN87_9CELL|nr:hypothetical protein CTE05_30280 [Cellulomonas terrae]
MELAVLRLHERHWIRRWARSVTEQVTGVVVLNWRDTGRTIECVRSLLEVFPPSSVMVLDNEATGALREALRRFNPDIPVHEFRENRGFAGAMNTGIALLEALGFSRILVVNNDVVINAHAIAPLLEPDILAENVILAAPVLIEEGARHSPASRLNPWTAAIRPLKQNEPADFLTWACVLVDAEKFHTVGGLNESYFMYWEDVEFGYRCARAGLAQRVVEAASVHHARSASHGNAGPRIDRYQALGLVVFGRSDWRVKFVGAPIRITVRIAKRLAQRRWVNALEVIRGVAVGLTLKEPAYTSSRVVPQTITKPAEGK